MSFESSNAREPSPLLQGSSASSQPEPNANGVQDNGSGLETDLDPFAPSGSQQATSLIPCIQKPENEPLSRSDIQYDFLSYIFENDTRAFTNQHDGTNSHTFAEIYIDSLGRSPKINEMLKERLISEHSSAIRLGMLGLLVNLGRIDATTFANASEQKQAHANSLIPCLQEVLSNPDVKDLHDISRIVTLLKDVCEDQREQETIQALTESKSKNPNALLYHLCEFQSSYFVAPYEFHDLIMNKNLSSDSRGKAFLWLMWAFLESDSSPSSLGQNPFGPGQNEGQCVPALEKLVSTQVALENVDTPAEEEAMKKSQAIAEGGNVIKIRTRSKVRALEGTSTERKEDTEMDDIEKSVSSPATARLRLIVRAPAVSRSKHDANAIKTRAALRETKCQSEVEKMLKAKHRKHKRSRYQEGSLMREWTKIRNLDPLYDSDQEESTVETKKQPKPDGGRDLAPFPVKRQFELPDDFGEESTAMATAFRRSRRWLERWTCKVEDPSRLPSRVSYLVRQLEREQREVLMMEVILREQEVLRQQEAAKALANEAEMARENMLRLKEKKSARRSRKRKESEHDLQVPQDTILLS